VTRRPGTDRRVLPVAGLPFDTFRGTMLQCDSAHLKTISRLRIFCCLNALGLTISSTARYIHNARDRTDVRSCLYYLTTK